MSSSAAEKSGSPVSAVGRVVDVLPVEVVVVGSVMAGGDSTVAVVVEEGSVVVVMAGASVVSGEGESATPSTVVEVSETAEVGSAVGTVTEEVST
ncbi:MAG: hypothetical protein F4135_01335 [Acidimicrobiia bacterium]|nr:hypothetical protein [Acidimicrobiia bacterium]